MLTHPARAQIGSEKELLLALLEDVEAKHAEVATLQAQQELTLKAVALAASERDAALRKIAPGNAQLAEARALADSKPHLIRACPVLLFGPQQQQGCTFTACSCKCLGPQSLSWWRMCMCGM